MAVAPAATTAVEQSTSRKRVDTRPIMTDSFQKAARTQPPGETGRIGRMKMPPEHDPEGLEAFEREMANVTRLPPDPRGRVRTPPSAGRAPAAATSGRSGDAGSEINDEDDWFAARGVDRREVRKLKRGDYAAEATLDLHGL